jgi:phosphate-selective porin OprO/OprP
MRAVPMPTARGAVLAAALVCLSVGVVRGAEISHEPGKGFKLKTEDGDFDMTLGARVQLRYTYEDLDRDRDKEDLSTFEVKRMRVYLKGKAFRHWKYLFQADFAKKQKTTLKDAQITWAKHQKAQVTVGQGKVFFDRQRKTSSGKHTFADVSLAASTFGIDRDVGVMFHGSAGEGKIFQYHLGIWEGEGEGGKNSDTGHLVVGRLSLNPSGDFRYSESDIEAPDSWKFFLDLAGAWNHAPAALDSDYDGDTVVDEADDRRCVAGAGVRGRGLYAQGEYYLRTVKPDVPESASVTDVDSDGWYAQAGYMVVPEVWEVAARYSFVDPDDDAEDDEKTEAMVGVNRFIKKAGHGFKLTADVAQIRERTGPGGKDLEDVRGRLQIQLVF